MSVKIRLKPRGNKRNKQFEIVVTDSRKSVTGKAIEIIGRCRRDVNPISYVLEFDRAFYWLSKGAQPTDAAKSILKENGVYYWKHLVEGVNKGAKTDKQAQKEFNDWIINKEKIRLSLNGETKERLTFIDEEHFFELIKKERIRKISETEEGVESHHKNLKENWIFTEALSEIIDEETVLIMPKSKTIDYGKNNDIVVKDDVRGNTKGDKMIQLKSDKYGYEINIDINNLGDNKELVVSQEYLLRLSMTIKKEKCSDELMKSFKAIVDIKGDEDLDGTIKQFEPTPENSQILNCEFLVKPKEIGKTLINVMFLQNHNMFHIAPLGFNVISPQYEPA